MTVTALRHGPAGASTLPSGRYNYLDLVRSEWTKMRTVRSTMWTLGVTVVLGIALSVIACAETRAHWSPSQAFGFDPTQVSLIGVLVAQLAIGVLGVLVMSAEYGTGTIRATFSAAPRRRLVLVAKASVFAVVAFIVSEVVAFISFFIGQALLTAPATHASITSGAAFRAVFLSGLYLVVLGLLGVGLATIIRHTAGAISAFVGIILVLPLITAALPQSLEHDVRRFLPANIGNSISSLHHGPFQFSPWVGFLVLCCYALGLLVIGGYQLTKRDA